MHPGGGPPPPAMRASTKEASASLDGGEWKKGQSRPPRGRLPRGGVPATSLPQQHSSSRLRRPLCPVHKARARGNPPKTSDRKGLRKTLWIGSPGSEVFKRWPHWFNESERVGVIVVYGKWSMVKLRMKVAEIRRAQRASDSFWSFGSPTMGIRARAAGR